MELYPLKFEPVYQYRIWGGNKLKTVLKKDITEESIGESWEISDVEGNQTCVKNGPLAGKTLRELIAIYKDELVGSSVYNTFNHEFPLLIKFIDAKLPLSVQVHPDNELARLRHNSFGKNEMWYIMQSDTDAEIIVGFDKKIDREVYKSAVAKGDLINLLHIEKTAEGDTFYIPTGRVHAIGAGVLLAEIQQTSDITYRIFDYNRIDAKTGKSRDLHTEEAADAIDFEVAESYKTDYQFLENKQNRLVISPYFKTNILQISKSYKPDYKELDSFIIYICVKGQFELQYGNTSINCKLGETVLVPACLKEIVLISEQATLLEVSL